MAKPKTQRRGPGRPPGSGAKGHDQVLVQLRPDQRAALRREALKRAALVDSGRADVSELVREAIDEWFRTHPK